MYRLSMTFDRLAGGLELPLDKSIKDIYHRFMKGLRLNMPIDDIYYYVGIDDQEFKETLKKWISYGVDKD